jgi:hypothetical protein
VTVASSAVEACCASLYGHPLVELIAGQSFHPGGLVSTRRLLDSAHLAPGARILDAGCGLGASAGHVVESLQPELRAGDVPSEPIAIAPVVVDEGGEDPAGWLERSRHEREHLRCTPDEHQGVERIGGRSLEGRGAKIPDLEAHGGRQVRGIGSPARLRDGTRRGIGPHDSAARPPVHGDRRLAEAAAKIHDQVVARRLQRLEQCGQVLRGRVSVDGRRVRSPLTTE